MKRASVVVRIMVAVTAGFVAILDAGAASASPLSDLAGSMQPGTFAELTSMSGWNSGAILSPSDISGCTSGDYITSYADKAAWDPVSRRVLMLGQAHGVCYGGRFVAYDDASNTWSIQPWPSQICQSGTSSSPCFDHAYDNNTVDPATGRFYYRAYGSSTVLQFQGGSWTSLPSIPMNNLQCCSALEFFPAMGKLIFVDGDWGVWAYNPTAKSWAQMANGDAANNAAGLPNLPMAPTSVFALYNPVQQILLFGGANHLYKMSSSGTITTMKTPPFTVGAANAVISVDPVGGKFLALSGSSMYQYDAGTDTWGQLSITVPATLMGLNGVGDGLVASDVTTYGVVMFIKYNNASSKVYLYKHSASAPVQSVPVPVKPDPPTNVTVQ